MNNKLESLDKTEKFLEDYKLPKLTKDDTRNTNSSVIAVFEEN